MMMNLPALQVVLPLLAAPICLILRRSDWTWLCALLVTWCCLAISILLLLQVLAGGPISYPIGDWAAPWGIEYKVDLLSAFLLVIVSAVGSVVLPYARASVAAEVPEARIYLFYTMYLLCLCGLLGIAITGDAFNLFVFLEVSSLSSYVLISMGRYRRSLTAAYRYLIMGTVGATFYIIGVGMMYMMTGTLNMADLGNRIPEVADTRTIQVAIAFIIVGLGLKLAIFPLHMWLPNAYTFAPSVVTVFLASTATKVAVYALLRMVFTVFGGAPLLVVGEVLMILSVAAMFIGSLIAIYQSNIKRMLAYSSIAQIGYMVLGISFITATGLTGGIIHLFNHALVKGALFMAVGCMFLRLESVRLEDMAGIGKRMPVTMGCFVIAGLGLIGVPLTAGFISKWYLVLAAFERDMWYIAVLILASSLLAVIYVWRVVEVAYFRNPPKGSKAIADPPLSMLVPLWIMTGASVYFGIDATRTVDIAAGASKFLMQGISQ
ncbi:MAG: cation:proton antiporter [Rhodospirillaceae bacterium]|nr:cation:proton antiporter [Rhodospirillaceae bacterium]